MTNRARIKLQERAADAYRIARAWYETSGEGQGMTAATQRNAADKAAEARGEVAR